MLKYTIAFVAPSKTSRLVHQIVEGDNKEAALRQFFNENLKEYYSEDDQGFHYFKEDFEDENAQIGSIIEI